MPDAVELAQRSFEAFVNGDTEAYVASFDEEVVWDVSAYVTGRKEYVGRSGVREFLAEVDRLSVEQGERFTIHLDEFHPLDDGRVIAFGAARIERPENPLSFETGAIYTFGENGKITRLQGFTSKEEARLAAGLI